MAPSSEGFAPLPSGGHKYGEDAVGLRISIFCSEGFDPSLEGIITSFDHETGKHGILFDTGVALDIDISKERVMIEQLPVKESLADDDLSDVLPPAQPHAETHKFPSELYRHSYELRAERRSIEKRNNPYPAALNAPHYHRGSSGRQGSIGSYSDVQGRVRNSSMSSNPELRRDGYPFNKYWSGDSSPDNYADTESNLSRSSFADQKKMRQEEIIGLRIAIYNSDESGPTVAKLEGLVMSYDDNTGLHGILFDSGIELDVDLREERVKLSRCRDKLPPVPALHDEEIEEEKRTMTDSLRQWIVERTNDITRETAYRYAVALYHHNIPSIPKLVKKIKKDAGFLARIGFDDDDTEEIFIALRSEYPDLPIYSPTTTRESASSYGSIPLHAATRSSTLQQLFQALHAQQVIASPDAHAASKSSGTNVLATAVAAITGEDPIPIA
jgi:hypothetical protein